METPPFGGTLLSIPCQVAMLGRGVMVVNESDWCRDEGSGASAFTAHVACVKIIQLGPMVEWRLRRA